MVYAWLCKRSVGAAAPTVRVRLSYVGASAAEAFA